jgi:hypothetical protein
MITAKWIDGGREPQCPPDPAYPDGIHVDLTMGTFPSCKVKLDPYPTPRCGYFAVKCGKCGYAAILTTAGRPDDPRSVKLPCKTKR